MFRKILIANRGKLRSELFVQPASWGCAVAVYSNGWQGNTILYCLMSRLHPVASSDMNAVLSAAVLTECRSHSSWFGFWAKTLNLRLCAKEVGVVYWTFRCCYGFHDGDKINARTQMIKAKCQLSQVLMEKFIPLKKQWSPERHPVMLKASAGGGSGAFVGEKGWGLSSGALRSASSEAAFGNGAMYMERVIYPARQ